MSLGGANFSREEKWAMALFPINVFLVFSIFVTSVAIFAPIFGGTFNQGSVLQAFSLIGAILIVRTLIKRKQRLAQMKFYEMVLACGYFILCGIFWFHFPLNLVIATVSLGGGIAIYVFQDGTSRY